jgi:DNA-binding NtrC family response regulator
LPLEEIERRYTLQVLEAMGGNKASTARALKVDRRTLYRKIERWGNGTEREKGGIDPRDGEEARRDSATC